MKITLEDAPKKGVWVEYDEDTSFLIRYAAPDTLRSIRKRHVRDKWFRGQKQEDVNDKAFNDDLIDWVLEDWKGILMPDGNPAPCNRENKQRFMGLAGSHAQFIIEQAQELSLFQDKQREQDLGN